MLGRRGGSFLLTCMCFNKNSQFCPLKGTVCDCGRYRKVVGQMDISVARLKTSMNFVKNGECILFCFVLFIDLVFFNITIPVFLAGNTLGWAKDH